MRLQPHVGGRLEDGALRHPMGMAPPIRSIRPAPRAHIKIGGDGMPAPSYATAMGQRRAVIKGDKWHHGNKKCLQTRAFCSPMIW